MAPVTLILVSLILREPLHLRRKVWMWTLAPQTLWEAHRKQQAWGAAPAPLLVLTGSPPARAQPTPTPGPPPSVVTRRILPGDLTSSPGRILPSQNQRLETG